MVEIIRTPQGCISAVAGKVALYSRYDPAKEAARFAAEFFARARPGKNPATIVLLGAGLGYLEKEIKKAAPASRLISVYYHDLLCRESFFRGDAWYFPNGKETVDAFFRRELAEHDVEGLVIIEWPASGKAFPEASLSANQSLEQVVRENAGNIFTTIQSGKQWIRNTLFNFLAVDNPVFGMPCDRRSKMLVIVASGPSLSEAVPLLKSLREQLTLWALPSSCMFLESNGISPDCVIATDGAFWAKTLLRRGCRTLAMPLSAAFNIVKTCDSVFLFSQPYFYETAVWKAAGITVPQILSHGTVAGSGLALAKMLGFKTVVFAGLDLCFRDVHSHVSPHPFIQMVRDSSKRQKPFLTGMFERAEIQAPHRDEAGKYRTGPSLEAYAGSFGQLSAQLGLAAYRLLPTAVRVPGIQGIDNGEFAALAGKRNNDDSRALPDLPGSSHALKYPDRDRRREIVLGLAGEWISLAKQKDGSSRSALFSQLLTFVAGQKILEQRKKQRDNDMAAAEKCFNQARETTVEFLESIKRRVEANPTDV